MPDTMKPSAEYKYDPNNGDCPHLVMLYNIPEKGAVVGLAYQTEAMARAKIIKYERDISNGWFA